MANRIPRNFKSLIIEALTSSMAGKAGDRYIVTRDDGGHYIGTNIQTEKEWGFFPAHIRNENLFKIVAVF